MIFIKTFLEFIKTYRNEVKNIKLVMLLIINTWLFIIFWKVLLLNDASIINNNQILFKVSNLFQPILNILGLDMLTPNMLKMLIITGVIIFSNLLILYFNQVMLLIVLTTLMRYSYKSYNNYIQKGDVSYFGFQNILSIDEKKNILKEYLLSKNEVLNNDFYLLLESKILNLDFKKDIYVCIDNAITSYKYDLLQKDLLQKDLILNQSKNTNINNSNNENILNNIDLNTIIKSSAIIIGVIIVIGISYYLYSSNVNVSHDMSTTVAKGSNDSVTAVTATLTEQHQQISIITSKILEIENKNLEVIDKLSCLEGSYKELKHTADVSNMSEIQESFKLIADTTKNLTNLEVQTNQKIIGIQKDVTDVTQQLVALNDTVLDINKKIFIDIITEQSTIVNTLNNFTETFNTFRNLVNINISDIDRRTVSLIDVFDKHITNYNRRINNRIPDDAL